MQPDEPKPIRKILILSANPKGTFPLRLSEEHRRIKDSLKKSDRREEFEIHVEPAVTPAHIQQVLLEHKPDIVHFCGHGAGTDGIVCEDEFSQIKLVPTAALSNLFKLVSSHVKCVFLNACFTEIQADEIVKHIEFVVGMKNSIGDEAALRFVQGFYTALFAGKDFVDCHKWGVNALEMDNIPEDLTPIIKTKRPVKKPGKKLVKPRPKILPENPIDNPEKKLAAPFPAPNNPASVNPDPVLSTPSPQPPVIPRPPLLRQMPKRTFLSLLISVFFNIIFICKEATATKRPEFAGYYIQKDEPDEKNIETPKDGLGTLVYTSQNKNILGYAIRTTLIVFLNSKIEKWQAIETTFLKYYYVHDQEGLKTKYFVGSSKAEYKHQETDQPTQVGKIQMKGNPTEGQCRLKGESLLGDPELARNIKELVNIEAGIIESKFRESLTEWYLDENGDLIKQERYARADPSEPGKIEKFVRPT